VRTSTSRRLLVPIGRAVRACAPLIGLSRQYPRLSLSLSHTCCFFPLDVGCDPRPFALLTGHCARPFPQRIWTEHRALLPSHSYHSCSTHICYMKMHSHDRSAVGPPLIGLFSCVWVSFHMTLHSHDFRVLKNSKRSSVCSGNGMTSSLVHAPFCIHIHTRTRNPEFQGENRCLSIVCQLSTFVHHACGSLLTQSSTFSHEGSQEGRRFLCRSLS